MNGFITASAMLNGCALTRHWTGTDGSEGRSLNFCDRREQRWHQLWIDALSGVTWATVFDGSYQPGK